MLKTKIVQLANSIKCIAVLYACSILLSATLFSLIESRPFIDGVWWSCVTSLTIGYGDIAPVTVTGKILGLVFGHFWVFGIIPLIVANILLNVIEDKNEFTHSEQEQVKQTLQEILNALSKQKVD